MPGKVTESPVTLEEYGAMDVMARKKVWLEISDIDEDYLNEHMEEEKAREAQVPQVGSEAPDFIADVLDPDRKRTGEQVQLSKLRGKPVAIAFGSYT